MKTHKSGEAGLVAGYSGGPFPMPVLLGPLLGLFFIVILPFAGVAAFILAGGYWVRRGLASRWNRVN